MVLGVIHIINVQPTNLHKLCDALWSIYVQISVERFFNLAESMPERVKTLKDKRGSKVIL